MSASDGPILLTRLSKLPAADLYFFEEIYCSMGQQEAAKWLNSRPRLRGSNSGSSSPLHSNPSSASVSRVQSSDGMQRKLFQTTGVNREWSSSWKGQPSKLTSETQITGDDKVVHAHHKTEMDAEFAHAASRGGNHACLIYTDAAHLIRNDEDHH
ncbi:hypothetical protein GUITHDRAFT_150100 [Guillardia theta CCMP2712]|uniref:Uncharacterized protein n=1 Tax=Guillardia theta (strain CCMP2712) TaxID=905079 RepID=L1K0H0_GUITC|nr:hypothetical protein GUITHDRAFT_150100 [Guillardia theta CCMP2712]EKX53945.1 hypothetical protein GUITHDRAFT_150100 [Guillardia theta CCMP2712]|mmetsp:Transcript_44325/g.139863  ORF Transcript_44325/g.139863 Transcript_44325/m.139863 type:complete len:155 (-) Transcript_44325:234-698(-)|eukprot:XP_005840925.1 hypothetical protein GUITHDRAFT_150100 [Guillardia theta CCMP2712]